MYAVYYTNIKLITNKFDPNIVAMNKIPNTNHWLYYVHLSANGTDGNEHDV